MQAKNVKTNIALLLTASFALASCSNIDCPLTNTVYATYNFYDKSTEVETSPSDTLTIKVAGSDSVLLNKAVGYKSLDLPMSYAGQADTLLLCFSNAKGSVTDSIIVNHTNFAHFENIDCGTAMFHTITNVTWTKRKATTNFPTVIDSISITNRNVNYEQTENFKIYLHNL